MKSLKKRFLFTQKFLESFILQQKVYATYVFTTLADWDRLYGAFRLAHIAPATIALEELQLWHNVLVGFLLLVTLQTRTVSGGENAVDGAGGALIVVTAAPLVEAQTGVWLPKIQRILNDLLSFGIWKCLFIAGENIIFF